MQGNFGKSLGVTFLRGRGGRTERFESNPRRERRPEDRVQIVHLRLLVQGCVATLQRLLHLVVLRGGNVTLAVCHAGETFWRPVKECFSLQEDGMLVVTGRTHKDVYLTFEHRWDFGRVCTNVSEISNDGSEPSFVLQEGIRFPIWLHVGLLPCYRPGFSYVILWCFFGSPRDRRRVSTVLRLELSDARHTKVTMVSDLSRYGSAVTFLGPDGPRPPPSLRVRPVSVEKSVTVKTHCGITTDFL